MNWVDILIVVLVLGLGFLGWRNGVIQWAFTLIGGIAGIILAGQGYKTLGPAVPFGDSEGIKQIIAFGVIFLVIIVGAWIGARLLKGVLKVLLMGWVDNGAGLALGVIVGAIVSTAIVSALGTVPVPALRDSINDSALAEPVIKNLGIVLTILPDEFDSVKELLDVKGQVENLIP